MMQQVHLKANDTHLITWVDRKVKKGDRCTLKGYDLLYDVIETYDTLDMDKINRAWRVGGIDCNII